MPLETGRASHSRWRDVGLVGRRDGGAAEGAKGLVAVVVVVRKRRGNSAGGSGGVRLV